jgi:ketosteroid isomerase-like protein
VSQENVEIVRRMLEAYARGSFAAAAEFAYPDLEMRFSASHPLSGTFSGAGAAQAMTDFVKSFDDLRGEAEQIIDADDDRVAVIYRQRGRPRGSMIEFNELWGIVFTLRDGKVARMEWIDTPAEALKAVGLEA